ncbi:MAG: carboxymuconolactone decarboxylase family protein [Candidatus Rokuibacteriota bacterium]
MDIRHAVGVRVGLPASKLAALGRYRESAEFAPQEVAALAFAEQVVRDDQEVSEACWEALRRHFSQAEAVELMFIVGYQMFASKFAKAFALVPQGLAPPAVASASTAAP